MNKKRKIVFLLLAFSLVIAFLPVQIYLPSVVVDAASQFQKYLNYSTSLNMMVNHLRYFNYSMNTNVFLAQFFKYYYTYSIAINITISRNLYVNYGYCTSIGIIVGSATSSSIPCSQSPGGGGGGGGSGITIPGNAMLSFATTLALVGIPVLLLAAVAGPAGLFVGLLIGGGMAFMANLLPVWLIIMLALAMLMLIALMMRRRE